MSRWLNIPSLQDTYNISVGVCVRVRVTVIVYLRSRVDLHALAISLTTSEIEVKPFSLRKGIVLPSSFVLTTCTGLSGPLPLAVNASTWNSYSVNFPRPVTFALRVELLTMNMAVNGSSVFVILYSSFIPCMEPADGNRQEANTLVEERDERLKLLGDLFGPTAKNTCIWDKALT